MVRRPLTLCLRHLLSTTIGSMEVSARDPTVVQDQKIMELHLARLEAMRRDHQFRHQVEAVMVLLEAGAATLLEEACLLAAALKEEDIHHQPTDQVEVAIRTEDEEAIQEGLHHQECHLLE